MTAGVPYFVIPQGMLDPWFRHTYPFKHLKKMLYWRLVEQHVLRDAHAVIFTAEDERLLATHSFSPWEVNGVVAAMGMAPPPGDPATRARDWNTRFPQLHGRRCLLYLGRLDRKKGIDLLLAAYAAVHPPAIRDSAPALILAGPESSPEFVATCRSQAKQLGLRENQDVFWTGMLNGDWKWAAAEAADALVLPTHQDNFGFVVVEALAVGTPVLLTERVNIWREIIADGAGLAAPDTLEGVSKLLAQHAAWTSAERAQRSAAAHACFAARFHLETAARRQLDILSLKA
jgi:glycosyltransferase involved in cell wall biosynthesis